MTFIVWFFIVVAVTLVVLCVALVMVLVRLSRELRQVGESTDSMMQKLTRSGRTLQLVVPLALAARGKAKTIYSRLKRSSHGKRQTREN